MIFDPLTAATLLVLADTRERNLCRMPKPTEIEVIPRARTLKYDYSKSLSEIQSIQTGTIDPHSFNGISVAQGYTSSSIALKQQVKFGGLTYTGYNAACIWYDKITIEIEIRPAITIAREVKADKCMGPATLNHEMKHVRALRKVVNKYAGIMGKEVHDALKDRGFIAGPVPLDQAQTIANRMERTVMQVLDHESKKLEIEHAEEQGKIDSREEYEYISGLCPDFNPLQAVEKRRQR
jgi:hypothetical protein